jgi:PTS system sucrose-specific IIC component
MGGTTLFPAVAMAGAGQVGAAIALYFKAKHTGNKKLQSVISGAVPAGVVGIGEPLIYGVTLPLMKPFFTAGLGAGFGGAWCMVRHVAATSYSPSGVLGVTIMTPETMIDYLIGLLIACVMAGIITWILIPESLAAEK